MSDRQILWEGKKDVLRLQAVIATHANSQRSTVDPLYLQNPRDITSAIEKADDNGEFSHEGRKLRIRGINFAGSEVSREIPYSQWLREGSPNELLYESLAFYYIKP